MSAIIIPLHPKKEEQRPEDVEQAEVTASGHFLCLRCKHEWEMSRSLDEQVEGFECPACTLSTGVVRGLHRFTEEKHWTCRCGGYLFHITRERVYCPNCGRTHRPWD